MRGRLDPRHGHHNNIEEGIDNRIIRHDKNNLWLSTKCLTFDKIPTVFDSFKQSSLIWLFQVKLESNVMPRYLVESVCLIDASSILILNDWLGLSLLELIKGFCEPAHGWGSLQHIVFTATLYFLKELMDKEAVHFVCVLWERIFVRCTSW